MVQLFHGTNLHRASACMAWLIYSTAVFLFGEGKIVIYIYILVDAVKLII